MADVDDVGQCRRKPEPGGMDHTRDAAAAADIKVAQAKVRRGVWQQELLVAFEFGEQRIGGHLDYLAPQGRNAKGVAPPTVDFRLPSNAVSVSSSLGGIPSHKCQRGELLERVRAIRNILANQNPEYFLFRSRHH